MVKIIDPMSDKIFNFISRKKISLSLTLSSMFAHMISSVEKKTWIFLRFFHWRKRRLKIMVILIFFLFCNFFKLKIVAEMTTWSIRRRWHKLQHLSSTRKRGRERSYASLFVCYVLVFLLRFILYSNDFFIL